MAGKIVLRQRVLSPNVYCVRCQKHEVHQLVYMAIELLDGILWKKQDLINVTSPKKF